MLLPVFLCLLALGGHEAKRVLIVSCPALSHMREMNYVGEELMQMGHDVYQVMNSKFSSIDKVTASGIRPIFYTQPEGKQTVDELLQKITNLTPFQSLLAVGEAMFEECHYMMQDKKFIENVKEMNFDLMLVDGMPTSPCRFILPYHLGVPYVYQFSSSLFWMLKIPVLPSFQPSFDITNNVYLSNKMNFWERTLNLFLAVFNYFMVPIPFTVDTSLLDQYAPGLTWEDLIFKSELFLITRDHMLEYPSVELPNVITSPGITIQPAKPLPADMEKLFHGAEHGVVLVSFGSLAQALNEAIVDRLFTTFSKLQQTVVMRFVGDIESARKKAPPNVHLVTWLPQNDALGHNKTVAFVTHCGNNGQYESLYHGVPMVGVPMFAEQHFNAFRVVAHGYGLKVDDITSFTVEELFDALSEVINDRKYRDNTEHAASIIQAQTMLPKAKLAYWVDHVMKFGGDHLRPSCHDLPLYKLFMLDVFAFLLLLLVSFIYLMKYLRTKCCRPRSIKPKYE